MGLVTPGVGLIIWMTIAFLVVWVGLGKLAWPTILKSIKEREQSIEDALKAADRAKQEMAQLAADNERILNEARAQRDAMLKEAKEMRDKVVADAKEIATKEAAAITVAARQSIENEKMAAITELKNQVATLSIDIAEKILKAELSSDDKQRQLVASLLNDVKLN
jgi:F-type H+-transporting ATPase subunit b